MLQKILPLLFVGFPLFGSLTPTIKENLVKEAQAARLRAYAPYSKYLVGAALLTSDGEIISGCNVENASYGMTNCAERSAVFAAVSQGKRDFDAMVVVTKDGGAPCGGCRQVLNEFNPHIVILLADEKGNIKQETTLNTLLVGAFGPHNLSLEKNLLETTPKPLCQKEMVDRPKPNQRSS